MKFPMATKLIAKDYDLYKSDTRDGALSPRESRGGAACLAAGFGGRGVSRAAGGERKRFAPIQAAPFPAR
ncbi:hypothetical protein ACFDR9_003781 [Janthinobacterium sp. CG_23.3]|uniref:hypothetical protein n=1 Tax=Janthinobacterium sp. CG_23.3 TaxID=3349634 RepID=UPI0038D470B3